jgi:tetratricopeptide (TPR) repeat protein
VTLYELLTLEPACNGPDRQAVLRQIAFEDPPHPRKLNRSIPVDLETIVLKAIAKNPTERYATARELSDDLDRFLRDEPVRAKRPTLTQKARKWAVRHQPLVWSGLVLLLVVVVGLTVSNFLLRNKQKTILGQQEKLLGQQEKLLDNQKELLANQEELIRERDAKAKAAAQTELINKFLTSFLSEAMPDKNARDTRVTAEELFRNAAQKITSDPKFTADPEVEASMRLTLGDTFYRLGAMDEAELNLRKAVDLRRDNLPPDHLDTLAAQDKLADFLIRSRSKSDEAEPISKQTWEARARVLGPKHEDTLDSMDTYALALRGQRKLAAAEKVSRDGCEICKQELGQDHERTLISQNNLATILIDKGELPEAEQLLRQCFEIRRGRPRGMEKEETLGNLNNLCLVRVLRGTNLDEAEKDLKEGVEVMARTHGKDYIYTLYLQHMLVRVYLEKGNYEKAETLGKETLDARRKQLKAGGESIGRSLLVLGRALAEQKKFTDAEPLLHDAATLFHQNYAQKKDLIADAENWLGVCLAARKRYKDAEDLLVHSYEILKADPGVPERHKDKARLHVLQLYEAGYKPEKAAAYRDKP